MRKSDLGIADTSKTVCRTLLEAEQIVPEDSLFQDDLFGKTCEMIQDKNEAKIIQTLRQALGKFVENLCVSRFSRIKKVVREGSLGSDTEASFRFPCVRSGRPQGRSGLLC